MLIEKNEPKGNFTKYSNFFNSILNKSIDNTSEYVLKDDEKCVKSEPEIIIYCDICIYETYKDEKMRWHREMYHKQTLIFEYDDEPTLSLCDKDVEVWDFVSDSHGNNLDEYNSISIKQEISFCNEYKGENNAVKNEIDENQNEPKNLLEQSKLRSIDSYEIKLKPQKSTYEWDHEEFKSKLRNKVKMHEKTTHEILLYKFDQCENKSTGKNKYKMYVQTVHKGLTYSCNKCEYKSKKKEKIKMHIEITHKRMPYKCDQCENIPMSKQEDVYQRKILNITILNSVETKCKNKKRQKRKMEWKNRKKKNNFQIFGGGGI